MSDINLRDLYEWCRIPYTELEDHPRRRVPFRLLIDRLYPGILCTWSPGMAGRTLGERLPIFGAAPILNIIRGERK